MVPKDGARTVQTLISGGQVTIEVFDSRVAEVSVNSAPPSKSVVFNAGNAQEFSFNIHGRLPARTTIFALDQNRAVINRMVVSVKTEQKVQYAIFRLRDFLNETPNSMGDIKAIMIDVENSFLKQANVRLIRQDELEVLKVQSFLGDPLDFGEKPLERSTRLLIQDAIRDSGKLSAGLNLVSSWTIKGSQGFTPPETENICVVGAVRNKLVETCTFVHEACHALGLRHERHAREHLMNDQGFDSFLMTQEDIDRINQTGLRPL